MSDVLARLKKAHGYAPDWDHCTLSRQTVGDVIGEIERLADGLKKANEQAESLQSRLHEATKAGTPYAADRDARNLLVVENQRLQAIIRRLPTTADGVPIFPNDNVWTWFPDRDEPETVTITRSRPGIYAGCYSTREAAENARQS